MLLLPGLVALSSSRFFLPQTSLAMIVAFAAATRSACGDDDAPEPADTAALRP